MRFWIGVMVLASLLVTAILLVLFGETWNPFQPTYRISILFPEAPGVSEGTPIRRSGVTIGKVVSVQPQDEGGVLVGAEIQQRMRLRHNQVCRITTNLLGDSMLNFIPSPDPKASKTFIEEGETLHGIVAPDPVTMVTDMQERLSLAINSVGRTSEDFSVVIRKVGSLLDQNEQRITTVVSKADETLTVIRDTANNTNEIVGDPVSKQRFKESMEELPQVLRDMRATLGKFNESALLMNRNLENLEGLSKPLGEQGGEVVAKLNTSVEKLDQVMDQLLAFGQALNTPQGTLGQVIHNRELYDNVNRISLKVECLVDQMQPIVRDARILSDRLARHPETIGVRGALERSPGTKGVPTFAPLR